MKRVYVKFLLSYSHYVAVPMEESVARQLITDWMSGRFALKGEKYCGNTTSDPAYAVRWDDVIGMHTFEVEQQMPQKTPGSHMPGRWRSGN